MVYNILDLGRTSLKAMQNDLDNTAHNISNVSTIGYKKKNTSFQELLNNNTTENEVKLSENARNLSINAGVKVGVETVNFKQGNLMSTSRPYDFAIEGPGYFGLRDHDNELILTRNGVFFKDANGDICNQSGYKLEIVENISKEDWGEDFIVGGDGSITEVVDGQSIELGKVVLYKPENRGRLLAIDETSFYLPDGNLLNSVNSPEEFGSLVQGYLEGSNAEIGESMVNLITTQRAYSANARAIETVDDIARMINEFKR